MFSYLRPVLLSPSNVMQLTNDLGWYSPVKIKLNDD